MKLRKYKSADADTLVKHLNDKSIYDRTCEIPYPYTMAHARAWIKLCQQEDRKKNHGSVHRVIEYEGGLVGGIGISIGGMRDQDCYKHRAELGYWLARPYRRMGIMFKALKEFVKIAFSLQDVERLFATVMAHNSASIGLLRKAGFKYEGRLRSYIRKDGKLIDAKVFSLLRKEAGYRSAKRKSECKC